MRSFLPVVALLLLSAAANAQSTEDSVKAAVNQLFTAMKTVDPVLLENAFADSAILQTIQKNKEGVIKVRTEEIKEFAEFLKSASRDALDERIVFDVVKVDADLAIVWTPYKFYYNGKFSHCGVNSFQLVRINNVWKIQYLIDTRRVNGCE
jgi:hypothetical protein